MANRNVEALASSLKIGDVSGGNYLDIDTDGTVSTLGTSTTWDDIQTSLNGRRLYSASGSVDYDYLNGGILFDDNGGTADGDINDFVTWSIQYPHKAKTDGTFNCHVHWVQDSTRAIVWELAYRVQDNGSATATTWTTVQSTPVTDELFTYTSGSLNQITELAQIDMSTHSLSAVVQCRLSRVDTTGGTVVLSTFVDAHYEADTLGSDEEYTK